MLVDLLDCVVGTPVGRSGPALLRVRLLLRVAVAAVCRATAVRGRRALAPHGELSDPVRASRRAVALAAVRALSGFSLALGHR